MPSIPRVPESEAFQIVLVGSFNPAIFHPQWFYRFKLVGEDSTDGQVTVVSPQLTTVTLGPIQLQCLPNRLTIETSNVAFTEKVSDLVQGVLRLLPHTPILQCGLNSTAHYKIDSIEYWHKIGHELAPKEPVWKNVFADSNYPPGMTNLSVEAPRTGKWPGKLNIIVQPSALFSPGLYIAANVHHDVPQEPTGESAAHTATFIVETVNEAFQKANRVSEIIFTNIQPQS